MLEPLLMPWNAEVAKCLHVALSHPYRSTVTQRHFWETLSDSDTGHQKLGRQVNWWAGSCSVNLSMLQHPLAMTSQIISEAIINIAPWTSSGIHQKSEKLHCKQFIPLGIFLSSAVGKASYEQQLMVIAKHEKLLLATFRKLPCFQMTPKSHCLDHAVNSKSRRKSHMLNKQILVNFRQLQIVALTKSTCYKQKGCR